MSNHFPDNWVIIKIKEDKPFYKILAGWSGGYTSGSSWRMNSGVDSVEETDTHYKFYGESGSCYVCHKEAYGLRMNNSYVWTALKERHGDKVELIDEDNWKEEMKEYLNGKD
jgi:hypothetical protein